MTKVFIDSDVILDLLIKRHDYVYSAHLFALMEKRVCKGFTSPLVIANVHYIMTKFEGKDKSVKALRLLRKLLNIVCIDEEIIDEALISDCKDFEDSIQYTAAYRSGMDMIVTRNKKDYGGSRVAVFSTREAFEYLDSHL